MHIKNIFNLYLYKTKVNDLIKRYYMYRRNKALDLLPPVSYLSFENQFRGSQELIIERQKKYIKYFKGSKNILDIGSGRGEFLQLLKKNNIGCIGIDNNEEMIGECKKNKLPVQCIDLFEYLLSCPDNYHDGIISLQVIEHLPSYRVQNFIKLCYDKVKKGSYVICETVNPQCLQAFSLFWSDLTHEKPLVPFVLKYMFSYYGFKNIAIIGRTPENNSFPDFVIDPINITAYGDYAIVARK